jgi:hypothetical protein
MGANGSSDGPLEKAYQEIDSKKKTPDPKAGGTKTSMRRFVYRLTPRRLGQIVAIPVLPGLPANFCTPCPKNVDERRAKSKTVDADHAIGVVAPFRRYGQGQLRFAGKKLTHDGALTYIECGEGTAGYCNQRHSRRDGRGFAFDRRLETGAWVT